MGKKQTQSNRTPTRRQIAFSRREQEQLRLVYLGLGLIGVLILIVLAVGLYQTYVLEPNSPIAIVDGVEITTRDYQNRVRYERFILENQYEQILQQQAALAQSEDEQLSELLAGQYNQLANQILQQRSVVDQQTVDQMINDQLLKVEAEKRNITISPEEVTEYINRFLAQRNGGLTAAAATETTVARAEASATAALWTPTPTFTPSPTLTSTEEITPTATPANTPAPAPTPTLNVIPTTTLSTLYTDWLNTLSERADLDETQYRQIAQMLVLNEKLRDELAGEVPTEAEQAQARHILVETEEEAQEVIKRLEAGEDFADLAAELSTDTGSGAAGGDLGFVPRGRFVEPVEEAIFSLPIGEISDPIESQFGWHIVEVLEREIRELSPTDYRQSQLSAYNDWLNEVRNAANIENLWTVDKAPPDSFFAQPPQIPAPQ